MPGLNWDDPEGIAIALYEKFPDLDPTYVRYTDMHQWITELDDFQDDPKKMNLTNPQPPPDGQPIGMDRW